MLHNRQGVGADGSIIEAFDFDFVRVSPDGESLTADIGDLFAEGVRNDFYGVRAVALTRLASRFGV